MSLLYNLSFLEGKGNQTKELIRGNLLHIEYVFNQAKYKSSNSPKWIKSSISGYALNFDGYSTYIKDKPLALKGSFTISAIITPRCFEACHGGVATTIIDQLDKKNKRGFALSLYQHGEVQFELGDGHQIEIVRSEGTLELYKKQLVTVIHNEEINQIEIYINSNLQTKVDSTCEFIQAELPLSIGLNNSPFEISPIFKGGMFSGLIDYIHIFDEALSSESIEKEYSEVSEHLMVPIEEIELDEQVLLDDVHRPKYHAIPQQHWMNEPHAPFYFQGKYHLFYQKNASGPYFSNLHWGHWTSDDLVFWQNEKTALFPQKGDLSPSGVWSGSAIIGPENIPYLFYTSANFNKKLNQGVGIALPKNIKDPHLVEWEMLPFPIIEQTEKQGMPAQFRDPFVWKDEEKELWYLVIGGGIEGKGPTAWIYCSANCRNWEFKGEFYTGDKGTYPELGTNWELPVFLPISDNCGNTKYVFIFMSYFCEEPYGQVDTYYLLGNFDRDNFRFVPDSPEPKLLDYGKFKFSGPSGLVDPTTGRTVVFSILQGERTEKEEYESGWAHNAGLPLELYLENEELRLKPLKNLVKLREKVLVNEENKKLKDINKILEPINHKMLEIVVEFEDTTKLVGLEVKKSLDNREKTSIIYDKKNKCISIDRIKSSLDKEGDIQGGFLDTSSGLKAHIFIDHSTIEGYFNHQKMITSRVYTTLVNSDYLSLIGDMDMNIISIQVFQLQSIWNNEKK